MHQRHQQTEENSTQQDSASNRAQQRESVCPLHLLRRGQLKDWFCIYATQVSRSASGSGMAKFFTGLRFELHLASAFMILPGLLVVTPETWKLLAFLSIASLVLVPLGQENPIQPIICWGIASGILSQVCIALTNPFLLLLWIPAVILIISFRSKSTFISEITRWLCIVLVIQ